MKFDKCKNLFIEYVKSYCSNETLKYYIINLELFTRYIVDIKGKNDFDINCITKYDFIGYITHLRGKNIKNTSIRTYCRAIKVFFRYLYFEGIIDSNITQNVKYPKNDSKIVVPLSDTRVTKLRNAIENSWVSERNQVIFSLMLDCGFRLQEVVNLNIDNINFNERYVTIVNTKNNKSRLVPLPTITVDYILKYLNTRQDKNNALVLDCYGKNRITKNAIKTMFQKLKKYDSDIHAHILRHTFATSYIMGGGNIELLRVLMGHDDYTITKNYIHVASQMGNIHLDIYKLDKIIFSSYITYNNTK